MVAVLQDETSSSTDNISSTKVGPLADAANDAPWYASAVDMIAQRMPDAIKGIGYAKPKGIAPLDDDDPRVFEQAFDATKALRQSVRHSYKNPGAILRKGVNPNFLSQFNLFMAAEGAPGFGAGSGMSQFVEQIQTAFKELGKNITLTVPLTSGFVPFDLVNPSRLIYPVYSPFRNKFPRVAGQGTSRRIKVITGVSGSQTGGGTGGGVGAFLDISQSELIGGSLSGNPWSPNIPASGLQSAVDLNVPYQFFGLSESLSWLAQFAGQGFEDASALANLILLQQFMLNEEGLDIAGTPALLTAPTTAATMSVRTAQSNEVALPASSHFWVTYTAANYYGETVMATMSADAGAVTATQVIDLTIPSTMPPGALWWNVYVNNQATTTPARTAIYRFYSSLGGNRLTIQGPTIPNAGTNPPAADTLGPSGTGNSTRIAGIIPTLTGQAATAGVYPTGVGWQAGYLNAKVGTHLSISAVNNMLRGLWSGDPTFGTGFGPFKADPDELVGEGSDFLNLSNDVLQAGAANNYQILVEQGQVGDITAGAAVSQFQNPITKKILKMLVHPWWPQGQAAAMSYRVPYAWSNISNIWEMVLVQDYLSVSWPVIDASFRYSMFMYGGLVCNAPQYCGLLQGLQKSDVTPYN